ncbi:MAG: tetratricopeptide repeat-containing sensor histidine kinase [Opitutae bacterium]|nr:tetratricopeptide repeat-containing sensor histidine kinase [Opitutae bacterium]
MIPVDSPRRLRLAFASLALAVACSTASAQSPGPANPVADSPSARIDALIRQARALDATEPARAIPLAREALALAQNTHTRLDELRALAQLSESLRRNSNYDEARRVTDTGLALPVGNSAAERLARAALVYESGQIYWNRGDYTAAEPCYLEAQRTAEELHDTSLSIRVLNSRGIVARHQKLFDQSEQHHRAALALAEQNNEADLRLQIRNNLAILLYDQHRFDEARPLLEENLRAHTASNNRRSMANAFINLGSLENTAANPAAALPYFEKALALRLELGVPRHIASARLSVALTLARLGRADEALAQLRLAAPIAEKMGSHELFGNLYSAFSEAHAAHGDFREALDYQRRADKENDIVAGEKTATTIAELRERFDAEKRSRLIAELHAAQQKKDAELVAKETELRRTRAERIGLASLLILGLTTAIAIISRQRAVARAERRIHEETRRARDAAEQATALKSKLLDLASHDLKAPLVGTMMTAETIAEESADRPAIAERAQALHAESQRMLGLVQDLLDSSAAESGRLELDRAPLDLAALAADVAAAFADRAARKNQRIEVVAAAGDAPALIDGDAARLRQVVENLLSNALKFSPAGTTTHLTVCRGANGVVRLEVRDEGPGLTPEDRAGLFLRFRRLSAAPTGGESSTGLGLALARDLVVAHGGKLDVESTPGHGATFSAEFPAAAQCSSFHSKAP